MVSGKEIVILTVQEAGKVTVKMLGDAHSSGDYFLVSRIRVFSPHPPLEKALGSPFQRALTLPLRVAIFLRTQSPLKGPSPNEHFINYLLTHNSGGKGNAKVQTTGYPHVFKDIGVPSINTTLQLHCCCC